MKKMLLGDQKISAALGPDEYAEIGDATLLTTGQGVTICKNGSSL